MSFVSDMTEKLDALSAKVAAVDATVEALYEVIKTTEGITPEAAAALTAKVDEISAAVDGVATDD